VGGRGELRGGLYGFRGATEGLRGAASRRWRPSADGQMLSTHPGAPSHDFASPSDTVRRRLLTMARCPQTVRGRQWTWRHRSDTSPLRGGQSHAVYRREGLSRNSASPSAHRATPFSWTVAPSICGETLSRTRSHYPETSVFRLGTGSLRLPTEVRSQRTEPRRRRIEGTVPRRCLSLCGRCDAVSWQRRVVREPQSKLTPCYPVVQEENREDLSSPSFLPAMRDRILHSNDSGRRTP
jgi:hypothetical protein